MNREREHPMDRVERFLRKTKIGNRLCDKLAEKLEKKIIDKEIKRYVQRIK